MDDNWNGNSGVILIDVKGADGTSCIPSFRISEGFPTSVEAT